MAFHFLFTTFIFFNTLSAAPTTLLDVNLQLKLTNDYAPTSVACPSTPLIRDAQNISSDEAHYYRARKQNADVSLAAWLKKQGNFSTASQPAVAFTSSGGGYRALLSTAGVIQALDSRDSTYGTSGIYQGLTYEAGLSGGAWFLSSFAGNNWPTISSLRDGLWEDAFQNTPLLPRNVLDLDEYVEVLGAIAAKQLAGFDNTIVDVYGRLLSYGFLYGDDAGAGTRLSTLTTFSNFTKFQVPYPILTARGVDNSYQGQCYPTVNATQYEFHPYEYGSWDKGVAAFARTQYMGSALTDGNPTVAGKCIQNYDNLGYVFGTSSDIFNGICELITPVIDETAGLGQFLEGILVNATGASTFQDLFGIYPNPFYQYPASTTVREQPLITMSDGGEGGQNVPLWPFLQPSRNVDVLIANDNSADTDADYPNGVELRQTYLNAQAAGLTRMPYIPDVNTFTSKGLNTRATFFGCNSTNTVFIVYLPNVNYTYQTGVSTYQIQYSKAETDGFIANGNAVATQNGTAGWPFCLACAIKHQDAARLPAGCNDCFQKYCYYQNGTTT